MSQGSRPQQTPPPAAPPPSSPKVTLCVKPLQNLLLSKYDPSRLLSRPCLLDPVPTPSGSSSSSNNNTSPRRKVPGHGQGQDNIKTLSVSNPQNRPLSRPTNSVFHQTATCSGSTQVVSDDKNKDIHLMPPPRLPPPTASRGSVKFVEDPSQPSSFKKSVPLSNSSPVNEDDASKITCRKLKIRALGGLYTYPKVDIGGCRTKSTSTSKKKTRVVNKPNKVVKYEEDIVKSDDHPCSVKELRLSTSSLALGADTAKAERQSSKRTKFTLRLSRYTTGTSGRATMSGKSQINAQSNSSAWMMSGSSSNVPSKTGGNANKQWQKTEQGMGSRTKTGTDKTGVGTSGESNRTASSSRKLSSKYREIPSKIPENPLVNHVIELLRHKRDLQGKIELMEEEGLVHRVDDLPKVKEPIPKGQLTVPNIPMTGRQTKEIMENRMTILLAHGGYTHSNLQPLNILTDALENFYKDIAHRLKKAQEMKMAGCSPEFPDPVERVLVDMNMGGARGIKNFYKSKVVDYQKRVEEQCIYFRKLYAHKIRLKVGMVSSSLGGNISSFSSTSTSSSNSISPGNSVLTSILSGLESPMGASYTFEPDERMRQLSTKPGSGQILPPPPNPQLQNSSQTQPQSPARQLHPPSTETQESPHPNQSQKQLTSQPSIPTSPVRYNPSNVLQNSISNPSNQNQSLPPPTSLPPAQLPAQSRPPNKTATIPLQSQSMQILHNQHQKNQLPASPGVESHKMGRPGTSPNQKNPIQNIPQSPSSNSSMVSINLNNNVDLGGFIPITSPGASARNVNKGITSGSGGGGGDSKAKLKEALSQRNLLRLNFEQVPSSCDSTVLLSSSSPSLSSSGSPANKNSAPASSSLSQTTRLKL